MTTLSSWVTSLGSWRKSKHRSHFSLHAARESRPQTSVPTRLLLRSDSEALRQESGQMVR